VRILQVVHLFVPRHRGGVEVYTDQLSREMARRHEVAVFTTEHRPGRASYGLEQRSHDGVTLFETIHNQHHATFEESYRNLRMEEVFARVLDAFRPDVVHLQHLLFHSLGYPRIARERGIPVVMTLHEYWMICLRAGQMILPDLTRCPLPRATDCAWCAVSHAHAASRLERAGDRLIRVVRRVTGLDLWPLFRAVRIRSPRPVKRWLGWAARETSRPGGPADPVGIRRVERRWEAVREALARIDHLVAPSPFLRRMFVDFGVPEERILLADYGFDRSRFPSPPERRDRRMPLRFGFVGSLLPVKGLHLAVEAFRGVDPSRAGLRVYGSRGHRPDYVQELERRAEGHPIRFLGEFDNERIAEILASLDVLVIPSVWYENSPLTIHEGFLAGLPVITSDLGGMKDLVREGHNGFLFRPGDAADLRRRVDEILARPEILDEVRGRPEEVRTVAEDAAGLERLYERLAREEAGAR